MLIQDNTLDPICGQNNTTAYSADIPYRFCEIYSFEGIMVILFPFLLYLWKNSKKENYRINPCIFEDSELLF
jgi:hypothetical protein